MPAEEKKNEARVAARASKSITNPEQEIEMNTSINAQTPEIDNTRRIALPKPSWVASTDGGTRNSDGAMLISRMGEENHIFAIPDPAFDLGDPRGKSHVTVQLVQDLYLADTELQVEAPTVCLLAEDIRLTPAQARQVAAALFQAAHDLESALPVGVTD